MTKQNLNVSVAVTHAGTYRVKNIIVRIQIFLFYIIALREVATNSLVVIMEKLCQSVSAWQNSASNIDENKLNYNTHVRTYKVKYIIVRIQCLLFYSISHRRSSDQYRW